MSSTDRHQAMVMIKDLPTDLCEGIGRVVTKFSYLENLVKRTIYDLRDLDTPFGRQEEDLKRKNIGDLLDALFAEIEKQNLNVGIGRTDFSIASGYEDGRNLFAHAIFVDDGQGQILVRDASYKGKWQPPGGGSKGIKKSVEPSGEVVDADVLLRLAENIDALSAAVEMLWREISPQLPNSRLGKI